MTDVNQAWLDGLKRGDAVAVHRLHGKAFLRLATVVRRTPSGRIILGTGETFKPNGWNHVAAKSCYADRCLKPPVVGGST